MLMVQKKHNVKESYYRDKITLYYVKYCNLKKNTNLKALFIISPKNLDLENSALKG